MAHLNDKEGAASSRVLRLALIGGIPPLTFTPRTKAEEEIYPGPWGRWDPDDPVEHQERPTNEAANSLLDWAELSALRSGPCPFESHRDTDWLNASGRQVCGICHPPVRPAIPAEGVLDYTRPEHSRRELPSAEHVERLAQEHGLEVVDDG